MTTPSTALVPRRDRSRSQPRSAAAVVEKILIDDLYAKCYPNDNAADANIDADLETPLKGTKPVTSTIDAGIDAKVETHIVDTNIKAPTVDTTIDAKVEAPIADAPVAAAAYESGVMSVMSVGSQQFWDGLNQEVEDDDHRDFWDRLWEEVNGGIA